MLHEALTKCATPINEPWKVYIQHTNPLIMSVACKKIWKDGHIQDALTVAICPKTKETGCGDLAIPLERLQEIKKTLNETSAD